MFIRNMKQRFTKFLLIVPPFYGPNVSSKSVIGTGAGYILEFLEQNKIENQYLDLRIHDSKKVLFDTIKEFKPDLMFFEFSNSGKLLYGKNVDRISLDKISRFECFRNIVYRGCFFLSLFDVIDG